MPYKPGLIKMLEADYEDAADKYLKTREADAHEAECYLMRMKTIGRVMDHTQRMIDGTVGKEPLEAGHAAGAARV